MYIRFVYVFTLSLTLFFASCSSIYMPNVPATPMFQRKGEVHAAVHANIKGNVSGSGGVAVGNHIALIANGSYLDQGGNNNKNNLFKQYLIEGALGYFTHLGKEKRQTLEVYAGYGVGSSTEIDRRASTTGMMPVETRTMDFDKIFVQVNYSSTRRNKLNIFGKPRELNYGTAIRASRVAMQDFTINDLTSPTEEALFIEPLFYTRMELNRGFQLQYTNGFNFNVVENTYLKAGNAVFTLGLTYNFGGKRNKTK
ncbi:hypothetical protein [Sphingobacterium corticibacterium]|uniref:Outer membrane protein beta-barrel domain-containing protein n=1 Tax=Sphingobacterium corticibacterium TaxID=2484746 RepID=A0A4V2DCL6_9SPHI|nr:hypothetical protein [Sphingobacterium corticibacterium]RZF61918.1 hypothetical protein EWE74_03610 [Sphingobacterium corticibacterium]